MPPHIVNGRLEDLLPHLDADDFDAVLCDPQVRNFHPTVKPLDLCRYLATLIRPPKPGKILVPFAGSGSEMIGCILAGWEDVLGIEMNEEYCHIAEKRIAHWRNK